MKKLLVALALSLLSIVHAEQIPAVWAFNFANVQGTYFREILNESNRIQTKYQFIAEHKPGAGGAVAAQYVQQRESAILGTAAGYFVRPYLYPDTPYQFADYKVVFVMALSPVALVSKNIELSDVLKKDHIAIGTAGAGSLAHLLALKFKDAHPEKDIQIVPYKSTTEALVDVFGGHIDLAFEFLGDAEAKGAKILGVTGTVKIKEYQLLKDAGYKNLAKITGVYLILAKKSTPDARVDEFRSIFTAAEKSQAVQDLYQADYSSKPMNLVTAQDYASWYTQMIKFFGEISAGQTP